MEDIGDEVGAIFEARGEVAEDKADEVDEAKLPELSAEEVARMDLPAVPTTWEPMAAVPELDLKVVNLPEELVFWWGLLIKSRWLGCLQQANSNRSARSAQYEKC